MCAKTSLFFSLILTEITEILFLELSIQQRPFYQKIIKTDTRFVPVYTTPNKNNFIQQPKRVCSPTPVYLELLT